MDKLTYGWTPEELEKCEEFRWTITTSLLINGIESETISNKIKWYNGNDKLQNHELSNYYALYKSHGYQYSLVLSNDEFEGWFLRISEVGKDISDDIVIKEFDEWYYRIEIKDLLAVVERKLGIKKKPFTITDSCPWNPTAPKNDNKHWSNSDVKPEKHLTARGIKAEKKLENVIFEYEMQVLGE